jgi:hypothetical protein
VKVPTEHTSRDQAVAQEPEVRNQTGRMGALIPGMDHEMGPSELRINRQRKLLRRHVVVQTSEVAVAVSGVESVANDPSRGQGHAGVLEK